MIGARAEGLSMLKSGGNLDLICEPICLFRRVCFSVIWAMCSCY